jgi:ABC-type uncharacterized transport system permease subunit
MDRWILFTAVLLAAAAALHGARYLSRGKRSRWTVMWMLGSFACQFIVLGLRSELRGSCPLGDIGEMFIFASWALTMCYLAVGSVFRLSLLGVFTAPLVCFLLSMALVPGMLESNPLSANHIDGWRESHAAFSVLAYGALGLAAVSAVMFLVLDQQLKEGDFAKGLFRNLPPVNELGLVVRRLLWLGLFLLTLGVISGLVMKASGDSQSRHLFAAAGQWVAYLLLLFISAWRGVPLKRFAIATVVLFFCLFLLFALL